MITRRDGLGPSLGANCTTSINGTNPIMIDLDHFAQECVRQGFYFGVNPHYLLGVAKLRSGITNDAVGGAIGPFRLTQAEWDAHREDSAFDLDFRADDITSSHTQIAVFALMVRRAFDAFEAANDRTPSAIELYHQQFPGASTPTLSADLGRALDTTAGLVVRAEAGVLATFSEETLIEQLGARATALKLEAGAAGDVAVRANYLVAPAKAVLRGVMGLGKAVLIEWVKQLQNLVCGDDPASTEERGKLRDAFGIGQTSGAVLLTSGLVAMGCPPAIAIIIAAIVMRRFVGSAVDVFCRESRAWVGGL